jgi:hypothetical protein
MSRRSRILASLLTLGLLVTAPLAQGGEMPPGPHKVPALRDGSRIALADVERAILASCASRRFRAHVVAPGVIEARRGWWRNSVHVTIAYTESSYSIRYDGSRDGEDAVSEHLAGLDEHIAADLGRTRERLNSYQKPLKRPGRFNPRTAA